MYTSAIAAVPKSRGPSRPATMTEKRPEKIFSPQFPVYAHFRECKNESCSFISRGPLNVWSALKASCFSSDHNKLRRKKCPEHVPGNPLKFLSLRRQDVDSLVLRHTGFGQPMADYRWRSKMDATCLVIADSLNARIPSESLPEHRCAGQVRG